MFVVILLYYLIIKLYSNFEKNSKNYNQLIIFLKKLPPKFKLKNISFLNWS